MLNGRIQEISINGGLQNCYDSAFTILDKVITSVEDSQEKLNETFDLDNDVNEFFYKVADFEEISINFREALYKNECAVDEILEDVADLGKQWEDSQYEEFSSRIKGIVQELTYTSGK